MESTNEKDFIKEEKSHLKLSNTFNETIGKLIRDRRKALNLSPVNIAKYLNINYQTYSKYETGKITIPIENLFLIAKLLDVSIDSWFDFYFESLSNIDWVDSLTNERLRQKREPANKSELIKNNYENYIVGKRKMLADEMDFLRSLHKQIEDKIIILQKESTILLNKLDKNKK
jgi:transcriptional regulator with XRE-family HTH domain